MKKIKYCLIKITKKFTGFYMIDPGHKKSINGKKLRS